MGSQREGISRMAMMLGNRGSMPPVDSSPNKAPEAASIAKELVPPVTVKDTALVEQNPVANLDNLPEKGKEIMAMEVEKIVKSYRSVKLDSNGVDLEEEFSSENATQDKGVISTETKESQTTDYECNMSHAISLILDCARNPVTGDSRAVDLAFVELFGKWNMRFIRSQHV